MSRADQARCSFQGRTILPLLGAAPLVQSLPMRPTRALRPAARLLLAFAALVSAAPGARADVDEIERWVPSFSLFFDALTQKGSGSVTSNDIMGPPLPEGCNGSGGQLCDNQDPKLRPDSSSSDTDVAPLVGGSLELMTPRLVDRLLSPRLFVRGDVAAAFGFERNLAGEGSIGPFAPPQPRPADFDVAPQTVSGQGSRAKAQVRRLVLSAGAGVAFSIDVFDRRLRIKPSAEYLRHELDLIGGLHRAVKVTDPVQPGTLNGFRFVDLAATKKKTIHAIGPGLELEVDTMHAGPFLLSVYVAGRGYYLLGDLDDTLTATNEFGESATFTFDRERWGWRGGAGLRFRFLPEAD